MNETEYKRLSLLIKKYCPDFIEEKYPKFIAFLKAYYDWSMEHYNPTDVVMHLIDWGDIDDTLTQFIDYFKEEYLDAVNFDFNGDIATFIKHSKEFYASRGTPESFRFLLRLLTGNTGTIFYPGKYLMKSSDGLWGQRHILYIEYSPTFTNDYISTEVTVDGTNEKLMLEGYEIHYDSKTGKQIIKLYVSKKGEISPSIYRLRFYDGKEFQVISTISDVLIIAPGNNYKIGDIVSIPDDRTFIANISAISKGRVDSYAILNGGSGYAVGDPVLFTLGSVSEYYAAPMVFVDEVDEDGAITSLDIRYSGYGLYEVPTFTEVSSIQGSGAEIEFISEGAGAIQKVNILSVEAGSYAGSTLVINSENGTGASLSLSTGFIYNEAPKYLEDGSFLSDVFKLQDSDYWQDYSYEIQSALTLDGDVLNQFSEYKDIFARLVHPVGFKMFNSFVLSNHIELPMRYVNSTFIINPPEIFLDFVNWIEMISDADRIIDNEIIFQHRFSTIEDEQNTTIYYYKRIGGEYVHSTIDANNT